MVKVPEITTADWQLSLKGLGLVEEGLKDVKQCIDIILHTVKGSDPLRPEFGSDVFSHVGKPVPILIPLVKKAIVEAISLWEKRVEVITPIKHEFVSPAQVVFNIGYRIVDDNLLDSIDLVYGIGEEGNDGSAGNPLILVASIPQGLRLYLSLILDGNNVLPEPPINGFGSVSDLFLWAIEHYYPQGQWYWLQQQGQIILYVNNGIANTGNLSITSSVNVLSAFIPEMGDNQYYSAIFQHIGNFVLPEFPTYYAENIEQLLLWAQENWSDYGTWSVSNNYLILESPLDLSNYTLEVVVYQTGAFDDGFNSGFDG